MGPGVVRPGYSIPLVLGIAGKLPAFRGAEREARNRIVTTAPADRRIDMRTALPVRVFLGPK